MSLVQAQHEEPKIDKVRQNLVDFTYYLFTIHYSLKSLVDFWKVISNSEYWIELLIESGYYDDKKILENCIELKKILISSINTAKKNNN